jgi:uncharacterized integral membrane protein
LYLLLAAWVLVIAIVFAVLNADLVVFHYYVGDLQLPLSLMLLLALCCGGMMGGFGTFIFWLKAKRKNWHLSREMKVARREIANLRAIPVKDVH